MEPRTKELKTIGNRAKEAAEDWVDQTKAAGTAAIDTAKAALRLAQSKATAGVRATDRAVKGNPYKSIGVAFGAGLLIGWLMKRRS